MGNDVVEASVSWPSSRAIKVHHLMCMQLMKFVDRISQILPDIELARPRCSSGIPALCSLNQQVEKAKLILRHCAESSKLYLAITGNAIVSRCEKVCNALESNLGQIQNMVPLLLASQISGIIEDLRAAKFAMESSEEEAGKFIMALLRQDSNSLEIPEIEAFRLAALKLHILSPKDLLIEKRSIKKLLGKVCNGDPAKVRILKFLLYLLRKYEESIVGEKPENGCTQDNELDPFTSSISDSCSLCDRSFEQESCGRCKQDDFQIDKSCILTPPEEFRCPISSKLMHDPVVIASGQTFERMWIEKWFNEGHNTCPKTQKKLDHRVVTPNSTMKDLISKWCRTHGIRVPDPCSQQIPVANHSWMTSSSNSIASFGSSLNDLALRIDISNVSLGSLDTNNGSDSSCIDIIDGSNLSSARMDDDSHRYQYSANRNGIKLAFLSELAALPWESQCEAVEDLRNHLEDNQAFKSTLPYSSVKVLINFLKDARDHCDVKSQRAGAQVLLDFLSKGRTELPSLFEDEFCLLASFLDSEISGETLAILEVLSGHRYYNTEMVASGVLPFILKVLDTQVRELWRPAIKILYNLSSNSSIASHIVHLKCIPKLVPFLGDSSLSEYCLSIMKNLCNKEDARVAIAEAKGCIASIVELLESGTYQDQENALTILLSLCSQRIEYCQLVMTEGIIPSLFSISVNGNSKGKVCAWELLRLLRDTRYSEVADGSCPYSESNDDISLDTENHRKAEKLPSKSSGFFKKILFSKSRS